MARVDQFLKFLLSNDGSDLHLSSGSPPLIRVHGELGRMQGKPLEPKQNLEMTLEILNEQQRQELKKTKNLDFGYEMEGGERFRANAYFQRRGVDMVFRAIPSRIPTLPELGFGDSVEKFTLKRQGIVLVTGPGGCGKSTTQAAMINRINESREEHIITVEDPIEFIHPDKRCLVNQREVGYNTRSFSAALKYALRQDPDVILVGEMRDLETISMAITSAETGHLVIGTLHTINATQSIDRIIDVFSGDQRAQIRVMVSESLVGVISQQLIKTADGKGQVAAAEILIATSPVKNLIRETKTFQLSSVMQTGRTHGMQLMDESLANLVKEGKIAYQTASEKAENKELFERLARSA